MLYGVNQLHSVSFYACSTLPGVTLKMNDHTILFTLFTVRM